MIDEALFEAIAQRYGRVASWAIWAAPGATPKSHIADMDVLDVGKNPDVLRVLRTDIVMVGLNFARAVEMATPFLNFHDANPRGQDYKIRYAVQGTPLAGAYMTDIIKDFPTKGSKELVAYLKKNPREAERQVEVFREELRFIGARQPRLLAFGSDAFRILKAHLHTEEFAELVKLKHYSHRISQEDYRTDVRRRLGLEDGRQATHRRPD